MNTEECQVLTKPNLQILVQKWLKKNEVIDLWNNFFGKNYHIKNATFNVDLTNYGQQKL
jgi:hypothetical protein